MGFLASGWDQSSVRRLPACSQSPVKSAPAGSELAEGWGSEAHSEVRHTGRVWTRWAFGAAVQDNADVPDVLSPGSPPSLFPFSRSCLPEPDLGGGGAFQRRSLQMTYEVLTSFTGPDVKFVFIPFMQISFEE